IDTGATADRASGATGTVIARVRESASLAHAQSELETIMGRLRAEHPQTNATRSARLVEMARLDDEQAGPPMMIVSATSTLVLLLACANVANLLVGGWGWLLRDTPVSPCPRALALA
ncbi:MAG: hypothetical protein H0W08_22960, partial [Acidobacteria bacterium]|nr:hypothetical protein [Acidobacteriota bacterium]